MIKYKSKMEIDLNCLPALKRGELVTLFDPFVSEELFPMSVSL